MPKEYTAGPWRHNDRYQDSAGDIVDKDNFSFIDVCSYSIKMDVPENEHWANSPDYHRELPPSEQKANANLIAAAPELLEALEMIMDDNPASVLTYHKALGMARKAIAKAHGA